VTRNTKIILVVLAAAVGAGLLIVIVIALVGAGLWCFTSYRAKDAAVLEYRQAEMAEQASALARAAEAVPHSGPMAATVTAAPADARPLADRRRAAIARGAAYLLKEQGEDGSWGKGNVGITALSVDALLAAGKKVGDPPVRKAVEMLLKAQKEDGGIYDDAALKTYSTSIALMVLVEADPKTYADAIEKARAYLIKNQWDEGESIDRSNPWYGGHGYGKHERPDLSNTQYFVEAMHKAGVPKDHPLWAKVVVFVSRSQDRSESNDKAFVGTDSGGMVYSPAGEGESKAGTLDLPDGRKGLKAYGSMTYAGFKSFIYANLKRDDPRVQAALEWIRKHWTFDENPDMGQQGLYYYYQTAARALKAWGEDKVMDARRRTHDWRAELSEAVLARQRPDGSWINEADRWFEGFGPVPTSYALIALAECQ